MSRTAQGVAAVKQCRLPPLFGYKTDVSQGAVKTSSATSFANLTAEKKNNMVTMLFPLKLPHEMSKLKANNFIKSCSLNLTSYHIVK